LSHRYTKKKSRRKEGSQEEGEMGKRVVVVG